MGSIIGKHMEEIMKKNQETMILNQQAAMERQMEMQNIMREQMMALQIARSRDLFHYWASFYATYIAVSIIGIKKTGKKTILAPLIPLTFILTYFGDMAYGSKMNRIRGTAQYILEEERYLLSPPQPLPTIVELDLRRLKNK